MTNKLEKYRKFCLDHDCSRLDSKMASERMKNTPKYKRIQADSNIRRNIHGEIEQMVKDGRGKIEILAYLMDVYPYPEYTKYYGAWIDNKLKQLKIKDNSDEGR